jgi:tetratricopeptide (TPR) repeat protein/2-polyprenyl-3-methyl-5-hydroxy-6-metoxy-1,4-benzoquinol methylase
MNRKQRRAAHKQGGGATTQAPSQDMFGAALRHHQAGRLAEAAELYRAVLAGEPRHFDSLHNLGAIALAVGHPETAIELIGQAIGLNDRLPASHYNIALAFRALGRHADAIAHGERAIALKPDHIGAHMVLGDAFKARSEWAPAAAWYREALAHRPDHAEAHNNLGNVLAAQGHVDEATAAYQRALALDPKLVVAYANLGNMLRERGEIDEAITWYQRGLAHKPDHADTLHNLAAAFMAQGKLDAAAAHFERALALKPDLLTAYYSLAALLLSVGQVVRALDLAVRALKLAENRESKALFVQCLREIASPPDSAEMRALVMRALSEPWGRPGEIVGQAIDLVLRDERAAACIGRADGEVGPAARDPLLGALLENARACHIGLERFLTAARAKLLEIAVAASVDGAVSDDLLRFYVSLARQCFINEYVYALTDDERAQAERLRETVEIALQSATPINPLQLIALAAYAPLHALRDAGALLGRPWPETVAALLVQQMREPEQERALAATMPRLTAIDDDVSLLVQEQYEQNPYPRWVKATPVNRPMPIEARLRAQFPLARIRPLGNDHGKHDGADVLVAGCGTGQQLIDVAQRIAGARVLAVDLSAASLAYAQRQTRALGLNIEYGQADILQLGGLDRRFDVVDCGGVLHHLADPLAGWRVLVSLLRPNGFMRVGLYSELARQDVAAAQHWVSERGHDRTVDGIRRGRQDLLAEAARFPTVIESPDFFSISDCRDLLFHVQEHRLTLPQIKSFLDRNGLTFLGFELAPRLLRQYAAQAEDAAMTDLASWHRFEQAHPHTFAGMYQFWLQAPAAR